MEKLDIYRQTIGSQAIALVDLNAELAARAARIGELEQSVLKTEMSRQANLMHAERERLIAATKAP
ncbi:hypothetical protein CMI37_08915 [Candidatus Pacearchaeota archaeon]|nr:hypothetical protein [Candidatus Pacearchaeota archaeon]|tara:strand:+ start:888 stop:1085 length:198 start_codon:yes stop_codon:yes gene_type:complete